MELYSDFLTQSIVDWPNFAKVIELCRDRIEQGMDIFDPLVNLLKLIRHITVIPDFAKTQTMVAENAHTLIQTLSRMLLINSSRSNVFTIEVAKTIYAVSGAYMKPAKVSIKVPSLQTREAKNIAESNLSHDKTCEILGRLLLNSAGEAQTFDTILSLGLLKIYYQL